MTKIHFEDTYVGMIVQDECGIHGFIIEIKNIHNVWVSYETGAVCVHCLKEGCTEEKNYEEIQVLLECYYPFYYPYRLPE